MSSNYAKKFKAMLDLIWALGIVGAMNGAVEWLKLLLDDDGGEDFKQRLAVEQWVEGQSRYTEERRI
ncbi:hypothetical protein ACHAP8_003997 [Fusarium lateritium]